MIITVIYFLTIRNFSFLATFYIKRILPNLLLNIPMTVFSAATLRSQIKASSIPPATACPSIAPITGLLSFSREGPLKHGEREREIIKHGDHGWRRGKWVCLMSKEEARKCRLHLLNRDKEKTYIFF